MNQKTNWWRVIAITAILLLIFGGFGNYGLMSWIFRVALSPFMLLGMLIAWGLAIIILVYFIKMILESLDNSQKPSLKRSETK